MRKSAARYEVGRAFRGSSALNAVGDTYLLLARPAAELHTIELRFQFRYAPAQQPRLLTLDPSTLWFSPSDHSLPPLSHRKVETSTVTTALAAIGPQARYNQLRQRIMSITGCSKCTAQLAISQARQERFIVQDNGHYRLSLE